MRYAIGDIQGCFDSFLALLNKLPFDQTTDELWIAGDFINRGPKSIEMLDWLMNPPLPVKCVLGNHELWALTCRYGSTQLKKSDTLTPLLTHKKADTYFDWLRKQSLIHLDSQWLMVHAGLIPQWSETEALKHATTFSKALNGEHFEELLVAFSKFPAPNFCEAKNHSEELCAIAKVLTRIRVCTAKGILHDKYSGDLSQVPKGYKAWFEIPEKKWGSKEIVFGHWASLGLHHSSPVWCIDGGCVWGRELIALRLEDKKLFTQESLEAN